MFYLDSMQFAGRYTQYIDCIIGKNISDAKQCFLVRKEERKNSDWTWLWPFFRYSFTWLGWGSPEGMTQFIWVKYKEAEHK